jgi:acetyl esterase/lipase
MKRFAKGWKRAAAAGGLLAAAFLAASCASMVKAVFARSALSDREILSAQVLADNVQAIIDVPYIDDGMKQHLLDVYYPSDTSGPFPVIINTHGGGYVYGDKKLNKPFCYYLASKGFIVFNINYRMAFPEDGGAMLPDQLRDTVAAANWIHDNIGRFPARADKVFLVGESAGAYLSVMMAMLSLSPPLSEALDIPAVKFKITAIGSSSGYFELEDPDISTFSIRSICLAGVSDAYYRSLQLRNIAELNLLPPVFMTTNADDYYNYMSLYFEKLLQKNDVPYELVNITDPERELGHVFNVQHLDWEESQSVNAAMIAFFRRY